MKSYHRLVRGVSQVGEQGFTLIELLVVIAIIGLLASVVLTSVNSARAKSRDASRVQEVNQVKNALELYYSTNKHYPGAAAEEGVTIAGLLSKDGFNSYMKSIPANLFDGEGLPASQYVSADGSSYELVYQTETDGYAKSIGCSEDTVSAFKEVNTSFVGAGCVAMNGGGVASTGGSTEPSFMGSSNYNEGYEEGGVTVGQSFEVNLSWSFPGGSACQLTASDDSKWAGSGIPEGDINSSGNYASSNLDPSRAVGPVTLTISCLYPADSAHNNQQYTEEKSVILSHGIKTDQTGE